MSEGSALVLFDTVEEAWFWFIAAQNARIDGARFASGVGVHMRPCEPIDILKVLDGLYRQRRLLRDHLLVLRHYGQRMMPPERNRVKEQRAYYIWAEAMERMEPILQRKGIVREDSWMTPFHNMHSSNDLFNEQIGYA